mgnify:CR=1 FL=1
MTVKLKHRPEEEQILLIVTALAIFVILPFLMVSIQSQETTAILIDLAAIIGSIIIFSGVWYSNKTQLFSNLLAVFMQVLLLVAGIRRRKFNLLGISHCYCSFLFTLPHYCYFI